MLQAFATPSGACRRASRATTLLFWYRILRRLRRRAQQVLLYSPARGYIGGCLALPSPTDDRRHRSNRRSSVTSHQHRARMMARSACKLAVFAGPAFTTMWSSEFGKVGSHEGCGLLLVAAEMDAPGTKGGKKGKKEKEMSVSMRSVFGRGRGRGARGGRGGPALGEHAAPRDAQQVDSFVGFISTAMVVSASASPSIPFSVSALEVGEVPAGHHEALAAATASWYDSWNDLSSHTRHTERINRSA